MLDDKRYGLTVHLLATKVLPALIPVAVNPALKLDQVRSRFLRLLPLSLLYP